MGRGIFEIPVAIIGGGIAGSVLAAKLAEAGVEDVFVFEKSARLGEGQSGHNSGVIHSGVYYEPGSKKARLCVEGNRRMYDFCKKYGIAHKKTLKLIVATKREEESALEFLLKRARENSLPSVQLLSREEVLHYEQNVSACAGLLVSSTGLVDAAGYLNKWQEIASRGGAYLLKNNEVVGIEPRESGFIVTVRGPQENMDSFRTRVLVNAAGIDSGKIAQMVNPDTPYETTINLGGYCSFDKTTRPGLWTSGTCVYPTPQFFDNGTLKTLGIHTTGVLGLNRHGVCLGNTVLVGPTFVDLPKRMQKEGQLFTTPQAFEELLRSCAKSQQNTFLDQLEKYLPREGFYQALVSYYPQVQLKDLVPEQRGYQVRILKNGVPYNDFVIEPDAVQPGCINWIMPSPGLTSAEPAAEEAMQYVMQALSQ